MKLKIAFNIWLQTAGIMSLVLFADYILFFDFMMYSNLFWYMKEIFIGLFIVTIIISFFVINYFFEIYKIQIPARNKLTRYFKIYFGILWRALIILVPIIGFIALKYHGSIQSRIWTVIIEVLAGFPAIWWYLNSKKLFFSS